MCIIVVKPAGVTLDEIVYTNCFNRNDHGAGISYVENNRLYIRKGIKKLKVFLEAVKSLEHKHLLIHCRVMSKGAITKENCHPFAHQSKSFPHMKFAIAHNGTLAWRHTAEKSDTRCFIEDALGRILDRDPWRYFHGVERMMLGGFIGNTNKMALMMHDDKAKEPAEPTHVFIINKHEGIEYNGAWFSNMSFTEETSRFIYDSDRKRIKDWVPKLFEEPKHGTYVYSHTGSQDDWVSRHYGSEGMHDWPARRSVGNLQNATNTNTTIGVKDEGLKSRGWEWKYDAGYGYYNDKPGYTGKRSLKDYEAWKKAKDGEDSSDAPPDDAPDEVVGSEENEILPVIPPGELDAMSYLNEDEMKQARKEAVTILKAADMHFNFAKSSTAEVCAFARGELRKIDSLAGADNQNLMMFMVYGAPAKK